MLKNLTTVTVKIKIDSEKWGESRGVRDNQVVEDAIWYFNDLVWTSHVSGKGLVHAVRTRSKEAS